MRWPVESRIKKEERGCSCSTSEKQGVLGLREVLPTVCVWIGGFPPGIHRAGTDTDQKAYPALSCAAANRWEAICERQRQTQGTNAPGCVDVAQPLGSDVPVRRGEAPALRVWAGGWSTLTLVGFLWLRKAEPQLKGQMVPGFWPGIGSFQSELCRPLATLRPLREPDLGWHEPVCCRAGQIVQSGRTTFLPVLTLRTTEGTTMFFVN